MAELNFNAMLYSPMQPEDDVSDYAVWLELCKRMDQEVADARMRWRISVQERDQLYRQMKQKTEELRQKCIELETRQKPPAPKKDFT